MYSTAKSIAARCVLFIYVVSIISLEINPTSANGMEPAGMGESMSARWVPRTDLAKEEARLDALRNQRLDKTNTPPKIAQTTTDHQVSSTTVPTTSNLSLVHDESTIASSPVPLNVTTSSTANSSTTTVPYISQKPTREDGISFDVTGYCQFTKWTVAMIVIAALFFIWLLLENGFQCGGHQTVISMSCPMWC